MTVDQVVVAGLAAVLLCGCVILPPDQLPDSESRILNVGPMSVYCIVRGKLLSRVAIDANGNIIGGACADPPTGFNS